MQCDNLLIPVTLVDNFGVDSHQRANSFISRLFSYTIDQVKLDSFQMP